jgi:phosphate-selective porin OprO/OprP
MTRSSLKTRTRSIAMMALAASMALPLPARAQDKESTAPPATDRPGPSARWHDGIEIASSGGDSTLQFGTLLQLDGRFASDDPLHAVADAVAPRRLRAIAQGRAGSHLEFRLVPDFNTGAVVLFDAYVDVRVSKAFRVRVGKDKMPVGLEQLYSDFAVLFPERSLVTNVVPNRAIGVQAIGSVHDGLLSYVAGAFNGVPDGANSRIESNGATDLSGRLTLRPFHGTAREALRGASVAVGATSGEAFGALPTFKSAAQQTWFSYASTASADGSRTRLSPSAAYYYKGIGAFGEYARTTQVVSKGATVADVTNTGWGVSGSFVLTGETATERGVTPSRRLDPAHGHWGALQLIARHSRLAVDPQAFADGLVTANSSQAASATGVGAVWYTDRHVKYVVTFERTDFVNSATAKRLPEKAVVFRMQLNLQPGL